MNNNKYAHYSTVGELLKFIKDNNIPDDAKILMQRVEDVYFDKHGWTTTNKEGYEYHSIVSMNEALKAKEKTFLNRTEPLSEEELEACKERYYHCWCQVKYSGDDNLYLDAHY